MISPTDIKALERILDWAHSEMLSPGGDKHEGEQPQEHEAMPGDSGEEMPMEMDIEVEPDGDESPKSPTTIASYSFHGLPKKSEDKRMPIPRRR